MQALDYIRLIWDYNYWAHHKLLDALATVSEADYMKSVPYSIGSLHEQTVHTMWAEGIWLYHRIQAKERPEWTAKDYPNLAAVRQHWAQVEADWRSYLAELTEAELERVIEVKRATGEISHRSVAQIAMHVVNHGTDHRGQILRIIHDCGGVTFGQDMIGYFREKNAGVKNA
jgi:uncharacterized damage-inducible protein DinB